MCFLRKNINAINLTKGKAKVSIQSLYEFEIAIQILTQIVTQKSNYNK